MLTSFPPLGHSTTVVQQREKSYDRFGEEPRTAGPMTIACQPEPDSVTHASGMQGDRADQSRDAPSFGDFIDMINPLQHIPVVNLIYRGLTGDKIGGAAQIVGGALFGGPVGAVGGTISAIVQEQTGQSMGDAALSAFRGETSARAARTYADLNAPVAKTYNFNKSA